MRIEELVRLADALAGLPAEQREVIELHHLKGQSIHDVAQVMQPVLGEADPAPLDWCVPLEKIIVALRAFRSLREILKTNFIEEGRKVKEGAGGMFYDPSALLAFVRFNFLLRRTLIELMHADLIAIRSGVDHLQSAGVRTVGGCPRYFACNPATRSVSNRSFHRAM